MDGGTGKRENKGGVPQGPGFRVDGKHHRRTGESCRDGRRAAPEGAAGILQSGRQQRLHRAVPGEAVPGKHTERLRLFPEKPDGLPQLPLTESVRTEGGGHRRELQEYRNYIAHLNRQAELDKEQVRIASTVHNREKQLFDEGLTAQSEYEEAKQTFLNKQQSREQLMTSLSSARIQEAQLQQSIIETQMEQSRESNNLNVALKTAYNELQVSINDWELAYLFVSPANGILSYNHIWQKNQNVSSGDKVFSIVAKAPGSIIGKIKLPAGGSGKVMPGQRVNISVTGYPYMEFGFLTGKVMSVSLLADDESAYTVTISLPQDLCTSYGKQLEFKGELTGMAEVMTDERSVTERLLSPLRYLWEKYL